MDTTKDIVLQFKLSNKQIFFILALALLIWRPGLLSSDTMTMTTYYPAPYGGYVKLLATGDSYLARDAGAAYVGKSGTASNLTVYGNEVIEQASTIKGTLTVKQTATMEQNINVLWSAYIDGSAYINSTLTVLGGTSVIQNFGDFNIGASNSNATSTAWGLNSNMRMHTNKYISVIPNSCIWCSENYPSGNTSYGRYGLLVKQISGTYSQDGIASYRLNGSTPLVTYMGASYDEAVAMLGSIGGGLDLVASDIVGMKIKLASGTENFRVVFPQQTEFHSRVLFKSDVYMGTLTSLGTSDAPQSIAKIHNLCYRQRLSASISVNTCKSGYTSIGYIPTYYYATPNVYASNGQYYEMAYGMYGYMTCCRITAPKID